MKAFAKQMPSILYRKISLVTLKQMMKLGLVNKLEHELETKYANYWQQLVSLFRIIKKTHIITQRHNMSLRMRKYSI